jgi:hypothetical protein
MTEHEAPRLDLRRSSGVWAVRSSSTTVYFVDADARALLRQTGRDSEPGRADNEWVPLVSLRRIRAGDDGVIRVGDRHEYTFDYDLHGRTYGWWIQRPVTRIERLTAEQIAALAPRLTGSEQ